MARAAGFLDGVQRKLLLADRTVRATERVLFPGDLDSAERILLTNSVRGGVPAFLPVSSETE